MSEGELNVSLLEPGVAVEMVLKWECSARADQAQAALFPIQGNLTYHTVLQSKYCNRRGHVTSQSEYRLAMMTDLHSA